MPQYIAAIDQGTTSTRCAVFDRSGQRVGSHQLEHEQIMTQPGWVEHNALEIWERTQDVIKGAMQEIGVNASDIAALGITNQRETTVAWDRQTGRPYHNALVWQDTRTDAICRGLAEDEGNDRFRPQTGLPLATYFSGPKIRWLLDNVDGLRDAAERGDALFGNMDSWLIWNLTGGIEGGVHVTDVTNAARTLLMNLETLQWDPDIAAAIGVPLSMLPEIRPSSDPSFYGHTQEDGPFGGSIPICGDLGDQHAAMVGQTCFDVGDVKNTYGTGCFMLLNTGNRIVQSENGLLSTVCYQFGDEPAVYALEGSVAMAGALVQWLRDNLKMIENAPAIEELAKSVEDNGDVYFVPAFSGLFAPHWRSDARGVIAGLTRYANRGHIARAVLEATAYQTREVLDAMINDSGATPAALKVDGGMVANELLMQFQSDALSMPVIRPRLTETTVLGAAYAAGLAVGFWSGTDELHEHWQIDKTWNPSGDDRPRGAYYDYEQWKKAVARTLGWV